MEKEVESILPGPSTGEATLPTVDPPAKIPADQDPLEDSSEDADPTAFCFALVQPYIQAVKQAIGWDEPEETQKKARSNFFPFLRKHCLFFL